MPGVEDGWDEDLDDLGISQDEEGGWEEDDDELLFDDDRFAQQKESVRDHQQGALPPSVLNGDKNYDGWEDDDGIDLDDKWEGSNDDVHKQEQEKQPRDFADRQGQDSGGWSDDDELFEEGMEAFGGDDGKLPNQAGNNVDPKRAQLTDELKAYINSLSRMQSSINAILEFEYNTPEKAYELQTYYEERVKLAEYTRTKELDRMDYEVVLPYGHIERDKTQIAEFLPDDALISRCSNQSLLADLLQVMTGTDLLVRPQYMAICFANWCHFKILLGGERGDMVHCSCKLHLSLPTAGGQRLNVAELSASVVFSPGTPMVEYRLNGIEILLLEKDYAKLGGTAEFLVMIGHLDEADFPARHVGNSDATIAGNYRDDFVENSQKFLSHSTQGMKSALQQMESVVNFQQKLNMVKAGYSTFSKLIPDTEDVLAAEQEAMEYAAKEDTIRFPRPSPPVRPEEYRAFPAHVHENSSISARLDNTAPQQHPPTSLPPSGETERPQSILGGLMRSGLSRLAKTVAIPDGEDAAIYGSAPPTLTPAPQLYRPEPRPPGAPEQSYRNDEKVKAPQHPQLHEQATSVSSGPTRDGHTPETSMEGKQPSHKLPSQVLEISSSLSPNSSHSWKEDSAHPSFSGGQLDGPEATPREARLQDSGLVVVASESVPENPLSPSPVSHDRNEEQVELVSQGWDGDKLDDEAPANKLHPQVEGASQEQLSTTTPATRSQQRDKREMIVEMDYDADEDIIATRKRWTNPRPHRPHLLL